MRLSIARSALTCGMVTGVGLGVFVATHGLDTPQLRGIRELLGGYEVSFAGSIVGFCYAFAIGSVAGGTVALIYNAILDARPSES